VAHGVDGLLVPPGDASALAGAIALALGDDELCARLALRGRAKASALRWSRIAARLESVYREAAGMPAGEGALDRFRMQSTSPEAEALFG
jgi:phosphatidylinositol alpha-mannosyltransferase